jgi:hypothetical protein
MLMQHLVLHRQPAVSHRRSVVRTTGIEQMGNSVLRYSLVTNLVWIGSLKFQDYEMENITYRPEAAQGRSARGEGLGGDESSHTDLGHPDQLRNQVVHGGAVPAQGHRASGGIHPHGCRVAAARPPPVMKLSVVTNIPTAPRLPRAEARGARGLAAMRAPIPISGAIPW